MRYTNSLTLDSLSVDGANTLFTLFYLSLICQFYNKNNEKHHIIVST